MSVDGRRGVCMPDGVEAPLMLRLVGNGLAEPDGVRGRDDVPDVTPPAPPLTALEADDRVDAPTESRVGRGVELTMLVVRRVGMREGVVSSVLSSDSVEP